MLTILTASMAGALSTKWYHSRALLGYLGIQCLLHHGEVQGAKGAGGDGEERDYLPLVENYLYNRHNYTSMYELKISPA